VVLEPAEVAEPSGASCSTLKREQLEQLARKDLSRKGFNLLMVEQLHEQLAQVYQRALQSFHVAQIVQLAL
jgi:hypothetical protein